MKTSLYIFFYFFCKDGILTRLTPILYLGFVVRFFFGFFGFFLYTNPFAHCSCFFFFFFFFFFFGSRLVKGSCTIPFFFRTLFWFFFHFSWVHSKEEKKPMHILFPRDECFEAM
eukprot:Rhum_TRINITY_DN14668_c20_g7::Rhum_TRINITY_DN14668_c20_g7_i1::g.109404::m.109404